MSESPSPPPSPLADERGEGDSGVSLNFDVSPQADPTKSTHPQPPKREKQQKVETNR